MNKPEITLFMIMSVDGKISTGNTNERDVDLDFPRIHGLREGLHQYYHLEQTTDLFSMNSGKVMAKIGYNLPDKDISKSPVSFIIIDNKPHLNDHGVNNLIEKSKELYLVTTNRSHPAYKRNDKNLHIIYYDGQINFEDLFFTLKSKYNINKITLQTGGTLNAILLRKQMINKINLVIAPALIGGKDTSTLIDGASISTDEQLLNIKALKLIDIKKLNDSYLQITYLVINDTKIDL